MQEKKKEKKIKVKLRGKECKNLRMKLYESKQFWIRMIDSNVLHQGTILI